MPTSPYKNHSDLLELLNERKAWNLPVCVPLPRIFPRDNPRVQEAATLHAKCEDSDPFAKARIVTALHHGFALPSDILKESKARLAARSKETSPFAVLAPLKKTLDIDAAWKSHKHAA